MHRVYLPFELRRMRTGLLFVSAIWMASGCSMAGAQIGAWPDLYNPFHLRTLFLQMDAGDWSAVQNDSSFTDARPAQLWTDGEPAIDVTVKRKSDPPIGSKVSLKIDINAVVPGQAWHGVKKLSLENGAGGSTVVREGVAWQLHRLASEAGFYGYDASYAAWVRLVVNGQPIGIYTSAEERDKQMLENRGMWKERATWLYKVDPTFTLEAGDSDTDSPTVEHVCYSPFRRRDPCPPPDLEADLTEWVDMQSMLTLGAIEAFMANGDGLFTHDGKNHFVVDFAPPTELKRIYFPWDLDSVLSQGNSSIFGAAGAYQSVILAHPWFREWYLHIMSDLLDGPLSTASLMDLLTRLEPVVAPALDADVNNGLDGSAADEFAALRAWLTSRVANVRDQVGAIVSPPWFDLAPGEIVTGTLVGLAHTNLGGAIYFTLDGADPRSVGGVATGSAYVEPILLSNTTHIAARVRDGTNWSALRRGTFNLAGHARFLRLTELNYQPGGTDAEFGNGEYEFIELQNQSPSPVNVSGCEFDGVRFGFPPGTAIAPSNFVVLVRNAVAFTNRYPGVNYHGIYWGALENNGEKIRLRNSDRNNIVSVEYDSEPPWPLGASGLGWSLVSLNPAGDADDPQHWRSSTDVHGSPGAADPPPPYAPGLVINEVLAHTDAPQEDAIELHNPTVTPVDISGWWLSDQWDRDDSGGTALKKFRIPADTIVAPGGFVVFHESGFAAPSLGTNAFAVSSLGDQVYLASASDDGALTGGLVGVAFGASEPGVAFGRLVTSRGFDFSPLAIPTLDATNAGPRLGPVIINEVSYHPDTGGAEYIELFNVTTADVDLSGWTVGGAAFTFSPGTTLGARGYLVLVGTTNLSDSAFRSAFNVPPAALVSMQAFDLGNAGEALVLSKPNDAQTNASIVVDRVRFNDKGPWPTEADGLGPALERISPFIYGNEPLSWFTTSAGGSPGRANVPTNLLAIVRGSKWKHHHHGRNLGTVWRESDYNDSGWAVDRAPLGYGYAALRSTLTNPPGVATNPVTTYLRKEFVIAYEPQGITNLLLAVSCDDGFVAYLNGQEVVRRGLAPGSVTHQALATEHASAGYDSIDLTAWRALLRRGANQLAVEVHQASVNDEDMLWDAELSYEVASEPALTELRILAITVDSGSVTLRWASSSGQRYQVQRSSNLSGWANVGPELTASGTTHEFTDTASPDQGFYRVLLSE